MACLVRRLPKSFVILEILFRPVSEAMAMTSRQKWEKWQEPISLRMRLKNLLPKGGKPIPFNSDPEKANKGCGYSRCGLFLHKGKAYNCCFLGVVHESVEMGVLDKDAWALAMEYIPLTVDASDTEIMDACSSKLIPQCKICPDFWEAY